MFTLGVMTDEISQDFAHALDVIEEFGVRTVELGFMWDKNICDLDSHELTQVLRMVRQRGFAVCNIASLFLLLCPIDDPDAYNEHIKILERSIQIAPLFDCQLVRCFSFRREDDLEAHWDTILERLELPVRMAESAGVTLALTSGCSVSWRAAPGTDSPSTGSALRSPAMTKCAPRRSPPAPPASSRMYSAPET